jgi:hypothetical protein
MANIMIRIDDGFQMVSHFIIFNFASLCVHMGTQLTLYVRCLPISNGLSFYNFQFFIFMCAYEDSINILC